MAKGDSLFAIFYDGEPIRSEFVKSHMGYTPLKKVYSHKMQAEIAISQLPPTIERDKIELVEYSPVSRVKFNAEGNPCHNQIGVKAEDS